MLCIWTQITVMNECTLWWYFVCTNLHWMSLISLCFPFVHGLSICRPNMVIFLWLPSDITLRIYRSYQLFSSTYWHVKCYLWFSTQITLIGSMFLVTSALLGYVSALFLSLSLSYKHIPYAHAYTYLPTSLETVSWGTFLHIKKVFILILNDFIKFQF